MLDDWTRRWGKKRKPPTEKEKGKAKRQAPLMDLDPPPPVRGRATPLHPLPFMPPATTGRINNSGTFDDSSSSFQQPSVSERLQDKPLKRRSLQQRHPPPVEQHQTDQPPPPVVQPQSDQPSPPAPERVQNQQLERDIDEEEDHELEDDFKAEEGLQQQQPAGFHGLGGDLIVALPGRPLPDPEGPIELDNDMLRSKAFALAREVTGIPPLSWVPEPTWNILRAYWQSREFRERSDRNRRNTASEAGSSSYRGGSIDTRTHRRRLEKFNAALKAAAGEDSIVRAAIDKNAMFAQYAAGGSKGRQLGKGNTVRAGLCVVDPLAQQNQQLQDTIRQLTQQQELFMQLLNNALAQNNINLQMPPFPQQPSSAAHNQPSQTNQNQDPAEETHDDEADHQGEDH
ncbi:TdcA1-ORF2 protein [Corchorus olitorius]|uniref:TdcA1-ORF2 protein n=1 Tax=Corchorus olitorius TaxID=93759 RepID=A0A1R3GHE9_9ROSI|nr:TdcA1-ORF2 protein [Corchorus olitorius]